MKKVVTTIIAGAFAVLTAISSAAIASAHTFNVQDATPKYTVVMQNKTTDQTFEEKGEYDKEKYDTVKADFSELPEGDYKVKIYTSNADGEKELAASTNWAAQSLGDAKYSVTAYFYMVPNTIEVNTTWIQSEKLNLAEINSRYKVVFRNTATNEFFEQFELLNFNKYDSYITSVDGIAKGSYDVSVYKMNKNGEAVKRVARTSWNCEVADGLVGNVKAEFFAVPSEVEVTLESAHQSPDRNLTIVMKNTKTGQVFETQAKNDFNRYDTDYAFFKNVPAGEYDVVVYTLNVKGGNTSLCANAKVNLAKATDVKINYYDVVSEIEAIPYSFM